MIRLPNAAGAEPLLCGLRQNLTREAFEKRVRQGQAWLDATAPGRASIDGRCPMQALVWLAACDGRVERVQLVPAEMAAAAQHPDLLPCQHDPAPRQALAEGALPRYSTQWQLATSGTTGAPKWQSHGSESLLRQIRPQSAPMRWALMYDPMRMAGLQVVLQALNSGGQLILAHELALTQQLTLLQRHDAQAISATPTWWRKLLMHGAPEGFQPRQITLGGEAVDQATLDALARRFPGARLTHIYAATETGVVFSVQDGQAGFPSQWLNDPDRPVHLSISEHQTLLVRPPGRSARDTGDLVEVQGERAFLRGRVSGAINVAGHKVLPEAVEAVIRSVPGVAEARVSARASGFAGQLVQAEVVAAQGAARETLASAVQAACRQHLPAPSRPALVKLVERLSTAASGKLERRSL